MIEAYWRSGWFGRETPQEIKVFRYGEIVVDSDAAEPLTERQQLVDHDLIGDVFHPRELPEKPVTRREVFCNRKGRLHRYEFRSPGNVENCEILQLVDYYIPAGER